MRVLGVTVYVISWVVVAVCAVVAALSFSTLITIGWDYLDSWANPSKTPVNLNDAADPFIWLILSAIVGGGICFVHFMRKEEKNMREEQARRREVEARRRVEREAWERQQWFRPPAGNGQDAEKED